MNQEIIEKSGTWFSYRDDRLGQGRENARAYLKENAEVSEKIRSEILSIYGIKNETSLSEG